MNFWPFRRRSKQQKPQATIQLDRSLQENPRIAAAWTTYAGTKFLLRRGDYAKVNPNAEGRNSPFDEECFAREELAKFWAAQPEETRREDTYLQLLADVYAAGFIQEYVWRFLRQPNWQEPLGLKHEQFDAWAAENGLADHHPQTLAAITE